MVATRTLVKIAAWGGVIISSTGFYLQFRLIDTVREYDYYKHALKLLRTNPGAVYLLGEPIKDTRFKLSDTERNFSDGQTARFMVPVTGPKDKGTYYFWAENSNSNWSIVRAELEVKTQPNKRLAIIKQNLE